MISATELLKSVHIDNYKVRTVSDKMAAAAAAFVKPPEEIQLSTGNPAHSWGKRKRRFDIYLKATGSSTQPGAQKVGLLLNHNDDKNEFAIAVEKCDAYFGKRDPQMILREKCWFHLRREPGQSIDSWVNTVKEKRPSVNSHQIMLNRLCMTK